MEKRIYDEKFYSNELAKDISIKDICVKSKEKLEKINNDFFTNAERKFLYLG